MRIRRLIELVAVIGLTILSAPLVLATAKGLWAGEAEEERLSQAHALLEGYRAYVSPDISFTTLDLDADFQLCGYERERLFGTGYPPRARDEDAWTAYDGYFDLYLWRSWNWRERADRLRAELIRMNTSAFSSEFLRICMRQSLLAPLCARRVESILAGGRLDGLGVPSGQAIDGSRWDRTICTYLDGVAARNGQNLATRRR